MPAHNEDFESMMPILNSESPEGNITHNLTLIREEHNFDEDFFGDSANKLLPMKNYWTHEEVRSNKF
jgi:hypothetical protein